MESISTQIGMALDEFIRLYDQQPFEFIAGVRIPKMPNVSRHDETSRAIFIALYQYTREKQLGEAMIESPFVISYTSNWVTGSRTPDVMYFALERIKAYREADHDYGDKPYILVPDLVIEVVSPNDNLSDLAEKVDQYLLDNVRAVWVVDPQKRKVAVHTMISRNPFVTQQMTLTVDDVLTGGDIVPGFDMALAALFA